MIMKRTTRWFKVNLLMFMTMLCISASAQITSHGSFEAELPSYWKKGAEPAGATLTWATDQARSMVKSLKISKATTSEAAVWESENMVDYWS
ncbi:MAG: hypothetical protein HY965_03425, partial [Ignavibacteriales bacterium]|nr:hypothetical protein [Ignavibacteriales bacterium]